MTTLAVCIIITTSFVAGFIAGCVRCYPLWRRQRIRANYFYYQYKRDVVKQEQEQ